MPLKNTRSMMNKTIKISFFTFLSIFRHSKNASWESHPASNSTILSIKRSGLETQKMKIIIKLGFQLAGGICHKNGIFHVFSRFFKLSNPDRYLELLRPRQVAPAHFFPYNEPYQFLDP